jgi:hypothetical protein
MPNRAPNRTPRRRRTDLALGAQPSLAGTEALLHAASVKAGALAAMRVTLEALPLLKPLLPAGLRRHADAEGVERLQRQLIADIYARYRVKPAAWEVEGILAVAQTQAGLAPLATARGLKSTVHGWLPAALAGPLLRYTLLEPVTVATTRAITATWAAGRYADSVCRLRKAGADWLPAPLQEALALAPSTLRRWSAEALSLALPPLRIGRARNLLGLLPGMAPAAATPRPGKAVAKKAASGSRRRRA